MNPAAPAAQKKVEADRAIRNLVPAMIPRPVPSGSGCSRTPAPASMLL
jgi:hypothetical protein